MKIIKGTRVSLRPTTLEERHLIFEWGHHSDIAAFIYPLMT